MVTWVTPSTASGGGAITAALWNTYVRDNMTYLKDESDKVSVSVASVSNRIDLANGADTRLAVMTSGTWAVDRNGWTLASTGSFLVVPTGLAGVYQWGCFIAFGTSTAGTVRSVVLELNSVGNHQAHFPPHTSAREHSFSLVAPLYNLVAGDTISVRAFQDTGSTVNIAIHLWAVRHGA